MTANIKAAAVIAGFIVCGIAAFFTGRHYEALIWREKVSTLEKEYAQKETEAYKQAEAIRQNQEKTFLKELEAVGRTNASLSADSDRVRKQFQSIWSSGSTTLEQCNSRAARSNELLSEAYGLAAEGEGLLRDRDARLKALRTQD